MTKDKEERKTIPLYRGLFQYFPAALAAVARVSHVGNEQHNPGQSCFDNREKSNDDYDCMLRHTMEAELDDDDGMLHAAKAAWRALRACQKILESRGAPAAPAARWPSDDEVEPLIKTRECPNDISQRISGDTDTARSLKKEYYYGAQDRMVPVINSITEALEPLPPFLEVGDYVRDTRDGWEGEIVEIDMKTAKVEWWKQSGDEYILRDRNIGVSVPLEHLVLAVRPAL